jgi:hypothetical protein
MLSPGCPAVCVVHGVVRGRACERSHHVRVLCAPLRGFRLLSLSLPARSRPRRNGMNSADERTSPCAAVAQRGGPLPPSRLRTPAGAHGGRSAGTRTRRTNEEAMRRNVSVMHTGQVRSGQVRVTCGGRAVISGAPRGQGRPSGQWPHTRGDGVRDARGTARRTCALLPRPPFLPVLPCGALPLPLPAPLSPACLLRTRLQRDCLAGQRRRRAARRLPEPRKMQLNAFKPSPCMEPNVLVISSSFFRSHCLFWLYTSEFSQTEPCGFGLPPSFTSRHRTKSKQHASRMRGGISGYGHESGRKATKEKQTKTKGKKSPSRRRPACGRAHRGETNSAHATRHEERGPVQEAATEGQGEER